MKKDLFVYLSIAILLTFVLYSCNNSDNGDTYNSDRITVTNNGLIVRLKQNIPQEALDYTLDDYKAMLRTETKSDYINLTLDEIANLASTIQTEREYPLHLDLYTMTNEDISLIKEDFPGLTDEKIYNSLTKIKQIYNKEAMYDLFCATSKIDNKTRAYPYQPESLSNAEYWLLIANFWKIDGTKKATQLATDYTIAKMGLNGHRDNADAFRHCVWNILIAKYTDGNKDDRKNWAKTFTDAHENGNSAPADNSLDNPMDFHNNAIGRDYWGANVTESGMLWWYKISIPDDTTINNAIYLKAQAAEYCTTTAKINSFTTKLIFIPYTVAYPAP